MAKSSSHSNAVKGYLKPVQHKFVENYAHVYGMTESAVVKQAVKVLMDTTPKEIRERIQIQDNQ